MSQAGVTPSSGEIRVELWLQSAAAEGQHLDIKRQLDMGTPKQNVEVLKDLTAMGNGGGGTVIFGLDERKDGEVSRVDKLWPLTDRQLISRLKDVASDSVRPTLDCALTPVDVEGGYVLIADIEQSPLGPYMVESGGEFRYWFRTGDRSVPMPERAVADAYAQASRRQAFQSERWQRLRLPVAPTWDHWPHLSVSALPEHEDDSYCDPARVPRSLLQGEQSEHARDAGLDELSSGLSIWSDGFIASSPAEQTVGYAYTSREPQATLRVHRGGAIGYGVHLGSELRLAPVRYLNAALLYVATVWATVGIRAGEVRIELIGLGEPPANLSRRPYPLPNTEHREPYSAISLARPVRVDVLRSAPTRHQLLRVFADRIANLHGRARELFGFELGPLYQEGRRTDLTAFGGQLRWADNNLESPLIRTDGVLRRTASSEPIGWWADGLFLDLDGNAVAALEFCTADGLPDDFMATDLVMLPNPASHFRERLDPPPGETPTPATPTKRWIDGTAEALLRRRPVG